MDKVKRCRTPKVILFVLAALFAAGTLSVWQSANAQTQRKKETKETYTRPEPRKPIKPNTPNQLDSKDKSKKDPFGRPELSKPIQATIPGANRYQEDKVFLEYADSLFRPANELEEFQVVKGKVQFRHGSMFMFCDSAFYYPQKNSMDAFGHVEMRQGDTLFVYADKLYYDGMSKHATLAKGPSRPNVHMKNRKVTLTTDSLDYDLASERGWYTTGGVLEDDVNTLTSVYGEYSPSTKLAKFNNVVELVNRRDGYRMFTDELEYNTATHIANINTQTRIEGANDTILTTQGWYNTTTDHAQLTSRSTIIHSDSARNVTTLEGDSIIYDKATRTSRAFMFRNPGKVQKPMVLTDTARKVILMGGYGEYNDSSRRAIATEYPLLIEYSRPDTLFLRADTILSIVTTEMVWPDSLSHNWDAETRARLRSYSSLTEMAASMPPARLKLLPDNFPAPGSQGSQPRRESSVSDAGETPAVPSGAPEPSGPSDSEMPQPGDESLASADSVRSIRRPGVDALGRDSAFMVPKDYHTAKALGRARLFNKDIQGIADTLIFQQKDSMLFMIRKPIVWNAERQVYGNEINVHFNDSTVDWAHLPKSGVVAEHLDEDFYNQLSGSELMAWFKNNEMTHLKVDGNVQTIFLPQEKDSTYNKLVSAESSYLTVDMDQRKMKHLKMWPEVTGQVLPLFEVKKQQQFLDGFRWFEALRPKRSWYGNYVRWLDDLGDVPDDLERYFNEAPVIRETPRSPFAPGKSSSGGPSQSISM